MLDERVSNGTSTRGFAHDPLRMGVMVNSPMAKLIARNNAQCTVVRRRPAGEYHLRLHSN